MVTLTGFTVCSVQDIAGTVSTMHMSPYADCLAIITEGMNCSYVDLAEFGCLL